MVASRRENSEKRKVTEAPPGDDASSSTAQLFDQVVKLLGKGPRPVSAPLDWVANIEPKSLPNTPGQN